MNAQITNAQFELQRSWFTNELAAISNEASNKQHADNLNPIKWVAGHIVNTRMTLLHILTGQGYDPGYNAFFGKGTSNQIDENFPTIEAIKEQWDSVSAALNAALMKLSPEKLDSPAPFQTSIPDTTLHGLIAYMVIHEAQHIGQLSILRKLTTSKL